MNNAYVLHHVHEMPNGEENAKLIGVYSSYAQAEAAIGRMKNLPGFASTPNGFVIDKYELDQDNWTEGFFTYIPNAK